VAAAAITDRIREVAADSDEVARSSFRSADRRTCRYSRPGTCGSWRWPRSGSGARMTAT